ncbi:MAG: uncharacterized protein QOE97_2319 [Pseudonocardiales bacterium]|nr:uncharacterized protein [Pseudonocardiales bacterium]
MRILLPPSEGKSPGGRGRPLRDQRVDGPLVAPRASVRAALAEVVGRSPEDAAQALLLPAAVRDAALRDNARVCDAPTMPALRRYRGVLYDGLASVGLSPAEQRRAAAGVLIFSGLFGVLRGDEQIPAYRVPAKAVLPRLGVVGTFWRPILDEVLPNLLRTGPVIDLRSSDYAAMWRPRGAIADRVITVRVLSPIPRGGLAVVSYLSKHAKGRLTGHLIRSAAGRVLSAGDVAEIWCANGGRDANVRDRAVELVTDPAGTHP